MKNYLDENYRLPTYRVQEEYKLLETLDDNKPSKRIINTKRGLKAIKALIDLEENHNVSWYEYLKERMEKNTDFTALFYRGTKIKYGEILSRVDNIAKYLLDIGICEGDEIPICMTNTPELVLILLAINKIGAKANIFGEQFDHNYIKEILSGCTNKVFFSDDSRFDAIKDIFTDLNVQNKVIVSLTDSLPKQPEKCDDYEEKLSDYYIFENKVLNYKNVDLSIKTFNEIENIGKKLDILVESKGDLETDFLITYTSGSTIIGKPKAIIHKNRSLIVSGRFHDCELSGNPDMKHLKCLAHIPPESNTDLIACISDILMQGWIVCLEPEYDHKKALDYIMINKPNYLNMTTSFFIEAAKQYLEDGKFKNRKLDFIFTSFAVGEKLSPGEEKLINKFLRVGRAGSAVSVNGFKFPFTTIGTAAGDCEHGAIYYVLWKKLFELKTKLYGIKECGMFPEAYVNTTVLKQDENGNYVECNYGELGILVANSYSNMSGYKNNPDATNQLIIEDNMGRKWLSCNTYGYIDKLGGVHVKGRRELLFSKYNGIDISLCELEEVILKDTKKILSCQVLDDNGKINIIVQFQSGFDNLMSLKSMKERILKQFPYLHISDINIIVIPFNSSYPLTHSGKRKLYLDEDLTHVNEIDCSEKVLTLKNEKK